MEGIGIGIWDGLSADMVLEIELNCYSREGLRGIIGGFEKKKQIKRRAAVTDF